MLRQHRRPTLLVSSPLRALVAGSMFALLASTSVQAQQPETAPPATPEPTEAQPAEGEGATPEDAAPAPEQPGATPTAAPTPTVREAIDNVATALADDLVRLELPPGAKLMPILDDARGSAWLIEVPNAPAVEMTVVDIEALGVDLTNEKAINSKISQLTWGHLGVEKDLGLNAKGRSDLKFGGCQSVVHTYADGDHQSRFAVCPHPTGRRLYIFRADLWPEQKADHDKLAAAFDGFLVESVNLLTPAPAAPEPTDAPAPTEPTTPTTPAPSTP